MLMSYGVFSQNFNMKDTTVTTCSGAFYDSGGSGGNYVNNENKTMVFTSGNGNRLSFNFQSFSTESGYDRLKIYDGPNASYPLLGEYSGSNSPGLVVSTGEYITFVFTSDGSNVYSGWAATISCTTPALPHYNMSSGTITACQGVFYDSGGPNGNYNNNEDRTMTFCSGSSDYVTISFMNNNFKLASGDTLFAYDGPNTTSPVIGVYCGTSVPEAISSITGTCITFRFKSDLTNVNSGWAAIIGCSSTPLINGEYKMMSGIRYTCGGAFYDSGGLNGNYSNYEGNVLTFVSPNNNRLSFNFQSFYTEAQDKLYIYDGPTTNHPLIGVYSGSTSPGMIESTGKSITFYFVSDGSNVYSGWAASISCTTPALPQYNMSSGTITTCQGVFYDSGGPSGNYNNNEDRTMTFCSGSSDYVTISFMNNNFKLASGDTLFAYDGPNIMSPMIGAYCGTMVPEAISSRTGSCITFRFKSDLTNVNSGWVAIIGCSSTPLINGEFKMMPGIRYTCGGAFYDSGGPSGGYSNYEGNILTFVSPNNSRLLFNFQSFYTEAQDKLYIYDGPTTNHPLIGVYSGSTSPGMIESTGKYITFSFVSDGSNTYSGWAASISCTTPALPQYNMSSGTITTCQGVFYDTGGPAANYLNNGNNVMTFCSEDNNYINFTFQPNNFKIHSSDTLYVYDGSSISAPLIGKYTGSRLPEVISSKTGHCLTFKFVSDAVNNDLGWKALIGCSASPQSNVEYCIQNGVRYTCGGTFYDSGGPSAVYTDYENYTETFISASNTRLEFNFQQFNVEANDYLYIYDGPNTTYPLIGIYSGSTVPGIIKSTGNSLTFNFSSDFSISYSGWVASINCTTPVLPTYNLSNTTITTCEGVFYDGGGPSANYPHNDNKEMTLCSNNGDFIYVAFQPNNFAIHSSDTLFVYDGANSSAPPIGIYYGNKLPEIISSRTGSCLTFKFKSNATNNDIGWQGLINCATTPNTNPQYVMQSGKRYTCGGKFYDAGGSSGNYTNNMNITETFVSSSGSRLRVDFTSFSLENGFDYLVVHDGPTTDYPVIARLTGYSVPPFVESTGTSLTFNFTSDGTNVYSGWQADFSCTTAPLPAYNMSNQTVTTCRGVFYDSGGPANKYPNNENKIMTFCSENNSFIKVDFTTENFRIHSSDVLKIYDGPSTSSNLMAILNGYNIPESFSSITGSCLTFEFISNSVDNENGWRALLSCVDNPVIYTDYNINQGGVRYVCGAHFYDSGGPSGNYGMNENKTMTFCSTNDCSITAEFNSFYTESGFDKLFVYDGMTTSDALLYTCSGTNYPTSLTSTNQCLTFKFTSDNSTVYQGWNINFNCDKASILASPSATVCNGDTVILTANDGVSYLWSTGATTRSISVTSAGYYAVTVSTASGCNLVSDPFLVQYATATIPTISPSGTIKVCPGQSVNLISTPGSSYLWNNGSTAQSTNVVTPGQYWVSVTNANGCVGVSEKVMIENYQVVAPSITPSGNISICYGDSVQISSSASNIVWNTGSTNSSIYAYNQGAYYLSATDVNGCTTKSDTLIVSFYNPNPPTISPSGQQTICEGSAIVLTSSSGTAYLWNNGSTSQSISVQVAGNYIVTVTDNNNCKRASNPVVVNVNPAPPIPTITENGGLLQVVPSSGYSYKWYFNGNLITVATSSFYLPTQNGIYFVEIIDNFGCISVSAPYNYQAAGIDSYSLENSVSLFPNPFADKSTLVINTKQNSIISIECVDILGRQIANIYQGNINSGISEIVIDAKKLGLAPGNYILNVRSNDEVIQLKMSVCR